MTFYRYGSDSLIDEIRIVTNVSGGLRAYLHAREGSDPALLAPIHDAFDKRDWKGVPHNDTGRPVLELRGFKSVDELRQLLGASGATHGVAAIEHTKEKINWGQRFRNATLRATGLIYNIGDVCYMIYARRGLKHHKEDLAKAEAMTSADVDAFNNNARAAVEKAIAEGKKIAAHIDQSGPEIIKGAEELVAAGKLNVKAGIGYAIGGSLLTLFGSRDQSPFEIKEASDKAKGYLIRNGADLSKNSSLNEVTEKDQRGVGTRIVHFISRYPSEILNFVYTGVGLYLASHAYKTYKQTRAFSDKMDIGLGAITTASSLAGIFIREKKPLEGQPEHHGLRRAWDWIQEKPLRATGYGFMVATAFHATSSAIKWKQGDALTRDTIKYRIGFVLSNIAAEVLIALSSKGHGQGVKTDESVTNTVIASVAETIAQQPQEKQQAIIEHTAGFLASAEMLGGNASNIAKTLRVQVDGMRHNPWAHLAKVTAPQAEELAARTNGADVPSTKITEAVLDTAKETAHESANWQERTEQQKSEKHEQALALA